MNTIEDAMIYLYERSNDLSPFDRSFVENMVGFDMQGKPYTSKQLEVCLKILNKYPDLFNLAHNVQDIISNRRTRRTPVASIEYVSQIRYAGGNMLLLRCKYSDQTMKAIKQLGGRDKTLVRFDKDAKAWAVMVEDENLNQVMKFIQQFKIEYDDAVVAFLAECDNSRNMKSSAHISDGSIQIFKRNNKLLDAWLRSIVWSEPHV